jgi:hypothetical protein
MLDRKDFDDLIFVQMLEVEQLVHLQDFCHLKHFQVHSKR